MEDHPELDGYEPFDEKPLRSPWVARGIKVAAVLGILLLVVPLVAQQFTIASRSAHNWCAAWVAYEINEPATPEARFEVFGPGFIGWECYGTKVIGGERYLGNLGLIPGPPTP